MRVVKEFLISEHKAEFVLTLPHNYQVLCVQIKRERQTDGRSFSYSPFLYVLVPADKDEASYPEEVTFRQVEADEEITNAFSYVGSYQERGYFKVKHLFRLVERRG